MPGVIAKPVPELAAGPDEYVMEYQLESERGFNFLGTLFFSANTLFPLDPSNLTSVSGEPLGQRLTDLEVPDESWVWTWSHWYVDMSSDVDDQGWCYAWRFRSNQWAGRHRFMRSFVRQRVWKRPRIKKHLLTSDIVLPPTTPMHNSFAGLAAMQAKALDSQYPNTHADKKRSAKTQTVYHLDDGNTSPEPHSSHSDHHLPGHHHHDHHFTGHYSDEKPPEETHTFGNHSMGANAAGRSLGTAFNANLAAGHAMGRFIGHPSDHYEHGDKLPKNGESEGHGVWKIENAHGAAHWGSKWFPRKESAQHGATEDPSGEGSNMEEDGVDHSPYSHMSSNPNKPTVSGFPTKTDRTGMPYGGPMYPTMSSTSQSTMGDEEQIELARLQKERQREADEILQHIKSFRNDREKVEGIITYIKEHPEQHALLLTMREQILAELSFSVSKRTLVTKMSESTDPYCQLFILAPSNSWRDTVLRRGEPEREAASDNSNSELDLPV